MQLDASVMGATYSVSDFAPSATNQFRPTGMCCEAFPSIPMHESERDRCDRGLPERNDGIVLSV